MEFNQEEGKRGTIKRKIEKLEYLDNKGIALLFVVDFFFFSSIVFFQLHLFFLSLFRCHLLPNLNHKMYLFSVVCFYLCNYLLKSTVYKPFNVYFSQLQFEILHIVHSIYHTSGCIFLL